MKKTYFILVMLIFTSLLFSQNVNMLDSNGHLQIDGYHNPVPVARSLQLHDGEQHLNQNTFLYHTKWDATNDFVDTAGNVVWTFVDGVASTLTQTLANQALKCGNSKTLTFIYDLAIGTAPDGTMSCWITGICDSTVVDVSTAGTALTTSITTSTTASTSDFVLHISSTVGTQGELTFDNMYLVGGTLSPVTIANSSSQTFITPVNAVELVIDPMGYDVKVEDVMGNYYIVNTVHSIPCVADEEITIANDSGASITLYFYYSML